MMVENCEDPESKNLKLLQQFKHKIFLTLKTKSEILTYFRLHITTYYFESTFFKMRIYHINITKYFGTRDILNRGLFKETLCFISNQCCTNKIKTMISSL